MHPTAPATLAIALFAGSALAQPGGPAPLASRTAGLLVADSTLDKIFFTKDRNNNGDARDPGEVHVFFDDTNASGQLILTTGLVEIFQSRDGSIYVGESNADQVIRLFDRNGDNDAQDAGEATVFFTTGASPEGFIVSTPNGIWEDAAGYVYVVSAGAGTQPAAVYRLKDLNLDGDAHDEGESSLYFDMESLVASTSAFGGVFLDGALYISDLLGAGPDTIIRAIDADGSGVIEFGEFGGFVNDDNALGVQLGFPIGTDGAAIYTMESSGGDPLQQIWRLTDLNSSHTIDLGSEVEAVWDELAVPGGFDLNNVFDVAFGPGNRLAVTSNGSDLQDNVFVLTDASEPADGDYLDAGETAVWVAGDTFMVDTSSGPADFLENARAVEFIRCGADVDNTGQTDVFDLLAFLDDWFASSADWNADRTTDVFDLLAYLDGWFNGCA